MIPENIKKKINDTMFMTGGNSDAEKSYYSMGAESGYSIAMEEYAALSSKGGVPKHPEDSCQVCGNDNPIWYCNNDLFNKINGSPNGILCPSCFSNKAEKIGIEVVFTVKSETPTVEKTDGVDMWTVEMIPDWSQCQLLIDNEKWRKDNHGNPPEGSHSLDRSPTELERFVYEEEPAGMEKSKYWRERLVKLLNSHPSNNKHHKWQRN